MIRLQWSADRAYIRDGAMKMWKTFDPANPVDPLHRGFRSMESLNEIILPPATGFKLNLDEDHEVVSYIREGGLLVRNRPQGDELLEPGCFQCANKHPWMTTRVPKTLAPQRTHLFLSSMKSQHNELESSYEHKRFPFADRHGKFRLIASPSGEASSLRSRVNLRLYSSFLEKGQHIVHELHAGRGAWLQVVAGQIQFADQTLETGDGAGIEDEAGVSFRAQENSEVLLFDLA
jgi:hypothetical protein